MELLKLLRIHPAEVLMKYSDIRWSREGLKISEDRTKSVFKINPKNVQVRVLSCGENEGFVGDKGSIL